MKTIFNKWNRSYKELASEETTISRLDGFNKTRYSRRKNQEGLLELASKEAHEQKKVYFATIYDDETPYCFLEIGVTRIFVGFLDEDKSMYLSYDWNRKENGKLFLQVVTLYEYHINNYGNQEIKKKVSHTFSQEGIFKIIIDDNIENTKEILTAKNPLSQEVLSYLWVDYPEFGRYDELIKIDRVPSEVFG